MSGMLERMEDVFDEEGDMLKIDEIAWKKLKEARLKDGFADGKYFGEESTLQKGFDHGYLEGFELAHSISVIQGLLAVAQMQISDSESDLMKKSKEIKKMLDVFKGNVSSFKLNCLLGDKSECDDNDDFLDCIDENSNNCIAEESSKTRKECYFSSLNTDVFAKNNDQVKVILAEFKKLREDISHFIINCNQPTIMNEISSIADKWGIQSVTRFSPCETQCSCVNESTLASSMPATSL